jgi:hypothetical protein
MLTAAPAMARDHHGDGRGYDRRDDRRTYSRSDRHHHDSLGEIVSDFLRDITRDDHRRSDRYYRRSQWNGYNSKRYDRQRDCDPGYRYDSSSW